MKEFKPIKVEDLKLTPQQKKKVAEGAAKAWPLIDESIYGNDKRSSDSSDEISRSE